MVRAVLLDQGHASLSHGEPSENTDACRHLLGASPWVMLTGSPRRGLYMVSLGGHGSYTTPKFSDFK